LSRNENRREKVCSTRGKAKTVVYIVPKGKGSTTSGKKERGKRKTGEGGGRLLSLNQRREEAILQGRQLFKTQLRRGGPGGGAGGKEKGTLG